MAFRKKMSRGKSRKVFSRGASQTQRINIDPRPMRGGIRL